MKTHITYLKKLNACPEAVGWADQFPSFQKAWDNCEHGDWMLWLLGKQVDEPGTKSRKKLVLTSCKCARLSLKYIPKDEKRPIKAIQTAEKYAKGIGGVTLQDVKDAANANADASYAASYSADAAASYAAVDAAIAAAYAADVAIAAAYAANADAYSAYAAASYAAVDAAIAAAYAADADAAYAAARGNTFKECADIVRKDYPKIRIK